MGVILEGWYILVCDILDSLPRVRQAAVPVVVVGVVVAVVVVVATQLLVHATGRSSSSLSACAQRQVVVRHRLRALLSSSTEKKHPLALYAVRVAILQTPARSSLQQQRWMRFLLTHAVRIPSHYLNTYDKIYQTHP